MVNKKKENDYLDLTTDLIGGGTGLAIGASAIGALPASGAQAGVQAGLTTAGSFFPTMATIGAAGIVTKQMRNLKEVSGQNKDKQSQGGFRL